jgi:hypothetical protein
MEEKFKIKLEEYKQKYLDAKSVCDKQQRFDVSFQAEVEDETLYLAQKEYEAVLDTYNFIFGEKNERTDNKKKRNNLPNR